MPAKFYAFDRQLQQNKARARFIVLDSCALVCTKPKAPGGKVNKRCGTVKTGDNAEREAQLDWLDQQLKSATKENGFAFVVVSTHWSMFSVMGNGPTAALQREVLPRLKRVAARGIKVLWFNGHDHSLQSHRFAFVDGSGTTRTMHFFVSGGGGFHTHPQLKGIAEGAYEVGGVSTVTAAGVGHPQMKNPVLAGMTRRSTLNEVPGLTTEFVVGTHGFLRVVLDGRGGGAKVEFYASEEGHDEAAVLVRTEDIS
jgi:hypothetical protein